MSASRARPDPANPLHAAIGAVVDPGALSISAETPETDAWLPATGVIGSDAGAITAPAGSVVAGAVISSPAFGVNPGNFTNPTKSPAPDLTAAWYIPQPWGHMDFSTVLRPALELNDGAFVNRSFMGYGIHFGGDFKPAWFGWVEDDIIFHFIYGDGIGSYLNANNFALVTNYPASAPTSAALAANVLIVPTVEWGSELGYQHWWMDTLRSNINAGINHHSSIRSARLAPPSARSRSPLVRRRTPVAAGAA